MEEFKEYAAVELIVEREEYAREGVHKGMGSRICDSEKISGSWLVDFPQYCQLPDIAVISVLENERIKAEWKKKN